MKASVVIGANYGDEGKGLMTDFLCRKHSADLVIRFNGGAQAGHTVVTPEGQRHVFSHIGSGYFAGAATYLSQFFVLNPILFRKEYTELGIPSDYKIYVHPNCLITTPWDMIANQVKEQMRGESRHGSCGVGFGETIERGGATMTSRNGDWLGDAGIYWFRRFHGQTLPEWATDAFSNTHAINEKWIDDFLFMSKHVIVTANPPFKYAIFEGAQGLALDQFMGNFPYVTRSNTGMRNVIDLQRQIGFELDEVVYVSRTYLTRHGADPHFEGSFDPLPGVEDKTNVPNTWQGTLRYQELSLWDMSIRVDTDVAANNVPQEAIRFAFTHVDQVPIKCPWANYLSMGETWADVVEV